MGNLTGSVMADHARCILPQANEGQLLVSTDWAEEWVRAQRGREHTDTPERWDKRASGFGNTRESSPYVEQFIALLDLQPGDHVFDMGCGNGAIAVPLAQAGFRVTARDFSAGMLECLAREAQQAGASQNIEAARMSWEDDWEACGIEPRSFDVAFASRSVITQDLGASLAKLSRVARRHACATLSTGYTPKISPTILRELGITSFAAYDYLYAFNILHQLGYLPEISYIVHDRVFHFDSAQDVREQFLDLLAHAQGSCDASELCEAEQRLDAWIGEHIEPNERAGTVNRHGEIEGAYKIVIPNDIRWAFVKWEV